jgi:hypothetical protein
MLPVCGMSVEAICPNRRDRDMGPAYGTGALRQLLALNCVELKLHETPRLKDRITAGGRIERPLELL